MNLERWLYRKDRDEYYWFYGIDVARHLSRQEEAEQEIEQELRA